MGESDIMIEKFDFDKIIKVLAARKRQLAAAGVMLATAAVPIVSSCLYVPQAAVAAAREDLTEVIPETTWASETEMASVPETTAAEEEYQPTPGELNLAHFFPEGADQSKVTESLAGKAFKELMTHDETWISTIYDMADATPEQMAASLGRPRSRVLGAYNYKDEKQDPKNPDTWTINSFKKVRMTFTNGDGQPVSAYSNVIDIMSMANLYTYFKGADNYDLFLSYAKELWENSHSYTIGISDIYYCEGCLDADADKRELQELEEEAREEEAAATSGAAETTASAVPEATETASSAQSYVAETGVSVITAGLTKPTEAANTAAAETVEETVPASTSGVIVSGHASSAETENASETLPASTEAASLETTPQPAAETEEVSNASSLSDSEPEASPSDAADTKSAEDSHKNIKCPGHVDLIVNVKVIGLKEEHGLFEKDNIGSAKENVEEDGWQGWNNYTKASARLLSTQDWFDKYGLSLSVISMSNPLSEGEIESYMNQLPADLSKTRQDLIRYALSSVGKVPYYWGGKPISPSYPGNSFGIMVSPDYKGRILKGLDCSGWINWVYWSVTGTRLPYESTSGLAICGTKTSRSQLQPGDIIIRTGADAHVIMFLGWTADGKIRCIHESSAGVNNVTVAIRDANWPYYRKLVD